MKLKNFTQAYFLIKYNQSYGHSLGKRGFTIAALWSTFLVGVYSFWPNRIYATEQINWSQ